MYEVADSMVFVAGLGSYGKIYGSSALPLELFVYDPEKSFNYGTSKE